MKRAGRLSKRVLLVLLHSDTAGVVVLVIRVRGRFGQRLVRVVRLEVGIILHVYLIICGGHNALFIVFRVTILVAHAG